jgi:acyl-CoA synthetase (AMP-forming)/AMP-acid ligase II
LHPDKLHTVGRPVPSHDIRLIDEHGRELAPGPAVVGEVVGRSPAMMTGYHGQPEQTRAAEWFDADGRRYIRSGDVGRFDDDGFLILMDRRKDMIISGGFNVYTSDLEAVLRHPAVEDAAVVGVPSPPGARRRWRSSCPATEEPPIRNRCASGRTPVSARRSGCRPWRSSMRCRATRSARC